MSNPIKFLVDVISLYSTTLRASTLSLRSGANIVLFSALTFGTSVGFASSRLDVAAEHRAILSELTLCQEGAPSEGVDQRACYGIMQRRADAVLNRAYQNFLAGQKSPEGKRSLRAAQRAWLSYRDLEVRFVEVQGGGGSFDRYSMDRYSMDQRLFELTMERALHLQN